MQRHLIGVLALLFLSAAAALYIRGVSDDTEFLLSVCQRVGLVLAAIWLAYEQVRQLTQRVPPWLVGAVAFALLVVIVRPRYFFVIAPLLAAIAVLQFFGWLFKPLPNPQKKTR